LVFSINFKEKITVFETSTCRTYPPKKEVLQNGVDLGKMNALLLKKVEELTLYVIDLKKEVEKMKNQ